MTTNQRDAFRKALVRRVHRGVAVLDEHRPGWADLIDLERLNLSSRTRCVLGQLYAPADPSIGYGVNGFDLALQQLTDTDDYDDRYAWAGDHGFTIRGDLADRYGPDYSNRYPRYDESEPTSEAWSLLGAVWHREILARQTP